ncbi:Arc family DNA-binding protein [Achromobacter xylosoxidans]|uniref:Arc family DNA-binding protein n=1 Tax=Alcaligenes xylosoxydans xylosoxydans TaxID=85698 RepID=UPI0006BF3B52|nr:Arc family DNA-binding protein [Achromobacter xylosoxidans]CUJ00935.1 Arc-like DNA binding domain [Achromobacter xylosoxidans]
MARTDPQVNFRMPADLKERLEDAAKKQGRSVTQEIIQRLEHSFTPWEERPWEERMVTDISRAMLKLLTKDEYSMLLDRVKAAGGAETVNGYAPAVVRSEGDLQPPIPDGPRLMEMVASLPPPESEKDAIATQLALAVLRMTGKLPEPSSEDLVLIPTSRDAMLKPLSTIAGFFEGRNKDKHGNPILGDNGTPSRTPKIPGQNAPKKGLGRAPKGDKEQKD